jgi:hypothetical protein
MQYLANLGAYWRLFARTVERINALTLLQNPYLPIIECNAIYLRGECIFFESAQDY